MLTFFCTKNPQFIYPGIEKNVEKSVIFPTGNEFPYEFNGVDIARVRNPGITSTIKGYVSYSGETAKALQNSGWLMPSLYILTRASLYDAYSVSPKIMIAF